MSEHVDCPDLGTVVPASELYCHDIPLINWGDSTTSGGFVDLKT